MLSVVNWRGANYGAMSYSDSLRQMIPAMTLITVGGQVLFSSFFLSLLNVQRVASRSNDRGVLNPE